MFPELPPGSVSRFLAAPVAIALFGMPTMPAAMFLVQRLGFLPIVPFTGECGEERERGEKVESFHPPPDVSASRSLTSLNPHSARRIPAVTALQTVCQAYNY